MAENTKKYYIVDASFVLSYLLNDEQIDLVDEYFEKFTNEEISLIAPLLLPFEVMNGLRVGVLRKRITEEVSLKLAKEFFALFIPLEEIKLQNALKLALENHLSVYDASYLSLTKTHNSPLLTLDKKLRALAKQSS